MASRSEAAKPPATAPDGSSEWVTIARLTRTHGVKGEFAAALHTDIRDRFVHLEEAWLLHPDGHRQKFRLARRYHVQLPRQPRGLRVVLGFEGINDMDSARLWVNSEVQVPRSERAPAPKGSYFLSDLVGCQIENRGAVVGTVTAVETTPGAAAMLMVHGPDGSEILIPFADAFLKRVALEERRIVMKLPSGLVEVNQSAPKRA
ncbi:MAG TPA: ribosome maturation factor RimM [Terriglobales bacterium]|nr:ribosome maturation factor RimM [Terriglobales bacterium]